MGRGRTYIVVFDIVVFGWRVLQLLNLKGGEVLLSGFRVGFFFGGGLPKEGGLCKKSGFSPFNLFGELLGRIPGLEKDREKRIAGLSR